MIHCNIVTFSIVIPFQINCKTHCNSFSCDDVLLKYHYYYYYFVQIYYIKHNIKHINSLSYNSSSCSSFFTHAPCFRLTITTSTMKNKLPSSLTLPPLTNQIRWSTNLQLKQLSSSIMSRNKLYMQRG